MYPVTPPQCGHSSVTLRHLCLRWEMLQWVASQVSTSSVWFFSLSDFPATVPDYISYDYYLVSTYCVPGSGAKCFICIMSFKFLQPPEIQIGKVTCLRSHSCLVAEWRLNTSLLDSRQTVTPCCLSRTTARAPARVSTSQEGGRCGTSRKRCNIERVRKVRFRSNSVPD